MKVAIVLYEGFDDLDAVGPYEILRIAAEAGAPLDVRLVTTAPADRVTSSHGWRSSRRAGSTGPPTS